MNPRRAKTTPRKGNDRRMKNVQSTPAEPVVVTLSPSPTPPPAEPVVVTLSPSPSPPPVPELQVPALAVPEVPEAPAQAVPEVPEVPEPAVATPHRQVTDNLTVATSPPLRGQGRLVMAPPSSPQLGVRLIVNDVARGVIGEAVPQPPPNNPQARERLTLAEYMYKIEMSDYVSEKDARYHNMNVVKARLIKLVEKSPRIWDWERLQVSRFGRDQWAELAIQMHFETGHLYHTQSLVTWWSRLKSEYRRQLKRKTPSTWVHSKAMSFYKRILLKESEAAANSQDIDDGASVDGDVAEERPISNGPAPTVPPARAREEAPPAPPARPAVVRREDGGDEEAYRPNGVFQPEAEEQPGENRAGENVQEFEFYDASNTASPASTPGANLNADQNMYMDQVPLEHFYAQPPPPPPFYAVQPYNAVPYYPYPPMYQQMPIPMQYYPAPAPPAPAPAPPAPVVAPTPPTAPVVVDPTIYWARDFKYIQGEMINLLDRLSHDKEALAAAEQAIIRCCWKEMDDYKKSLEERAAEGAAEGGEAP